MPAITVLMPVYNAERFLTVAIDSILGQTFTDFEFLIIDDCSTDASADIIKAYTDSRIRYFRNEKNLGISLSLNRGIELAGSPLIARMDSDDISYPERLQTQYDFIRAHPDGALYSCWVKVVGQDGHLIREEHFKSRFYYYNLTFVCWIYHPSIVFRKKEIQEIGMYTVPYAEDFELFWQISRRFKIYNIPAVLLDYRVTDQSLHQVLKKKEYEEAQYQQLLRNFRYYAGDGYTISRDCIDCLQHNFQPLLQHGSVAKIVSCMRELELLSRAIAVKENINCDPTAIQEAAFYKKRYIIEQLTQELPVPKAAALLVNLREYKRLKNLVKREIKKLLPASILKKIQEKKSGKRSSQADRH
jgi:glycosyltransferase involved in cell wall biosynthesis